MLTKYALAAVLIFGGVLSGIAQETPESVPIELEVLKAYIGVWGAEIDRKPRTVGEQVIRAIRTQKFYIICDGTDSREMLEERCWDMLAAMDRQFPESADE